MVRVKQTARKSAAGRLPDRRRMAPIRTPDPNVQTRLNHDHFSAWIKVGYEELPLYDQDVRIYQGGGEVVVSAYIPSESGKSFSVYWSDTRRSYSTGAIVYIDNVEIGWGHIPSIRSASEHKGPRTNCISSMRTSAEFTQCLMFADIETTADDAYLDRPPDASLGQIKVAIAKCKATWVRKRKRSKKRSKNEKKPKYTVPDLSEPVHEQSVKASGHRFQLGQKTYRPVPDSSDSEFDSESEDKPPYEKRWNFEVPHVTFIFKYRSKARLQADGIIPRDEVQEINNPEDEAEPSDQSSPQQQPPIVHYQSSVSDASSSAGSSSSPRPRSPSQASAITELEYIDDPLLTAPQVPIPADEPEVPEGSTSDIDEQPAQVVSQLESERSKESLGDDGGAAAMTTSPAPRIREGSFVQTTQSPLHVHSSERDGIAHKPETRDVVCAHETTKSLSRSGNNDAAAALAVPAPAVEAIHVKKEAEVKQDALDDDSLDGRVRWLQAELQSVTEELNRRKKVKKEIKEEDPTISLAVEQGVSEDGRFVIDLTELLDD